jgi:hypothetical protein
MHGLFVAEEIGLSSKLRISGAILMPADPFPHRTNDEDCRSIPLTALERFSDLHFVNGKT